MKNRLIIKSLIKTSVLLFVFSIGQAEEITKVGTSAAGFLQMENGSRAMAMGGSLVADANDASAVFWNPASVGISNKFSSYYEQTQLYADISQYNIGFSYPLNGNQSLAILINYLDLGRMDITTVLEPEGTGNTFDAASYFMAAAYAKSLTDRVRVGISFKLFEERIWLEKANGFAVDLGTLYNFSDTGVRVGMNLSNLGPTLSMDDGPHLGFYRDASESIPGQPEPLSQFITQSFQLPLTFTMGVSLDLMGKKGLISKSDNQTVIFNISANDGFDLPFRMNAGLEYNYFDKAALRMGWHENYDMAGLSFGAGVNIPIPGVGIWTIDYAWVDYEALGAVTSWGLSYQF